MQILLTSLDNNSRLSIIQTSVVKVFLQFYELNKIISTFPDSIVCLYSLFKRNF